MVSPPNHPRFSLADIRAKRCSHQGRPKDRPGWLRRRLAHSASSLAHLDGLDHSIHRILMNLREPTTQPREPKSCDLLNPVLPQMLQDFFVQCEGVIKKQGKTERTLVIPMRKESHSIPRLSCSSFLLVSAVRRNSCAKLQQLPHIASGESFTSFQKRCWQRTCVHSILLLMEKIL